MPGNPRLAQWLVNIGLLIASVVLFLGGIELFLRLTGLQTTAPTAPLIYQRNPDPLISYELKPGMVNVPGFRDRVTTDAHGFRSPAINQSKPTIVLLGDSVTFGYGVENNQTLAAHLSRAFPLFNVVNTGVPGYGLTQEVETYEKKLAPLKPSVLILVFFIGDFGRQIAWLDSQDILRVPGWKPDQSRCAPIEQGILAFIPGKCWLDAHSALYKLLEKFVTRRAVQQDLAAGQHQALQNVYQETVTPQEMAESRKEFEPLQSMLSPTLPRLFVLWPDRDIHLEARTFLRQLALSHGWKFLDLYEFFGNRMETLPGDSIHPSVQSIEEAASIMANTLKHEKLLK